MTPTGRWSYSRPEIQELYRRWPIRPGVHFSNYSELERRILMPRVLLVKEWQLPETFNCATHEEATRTAQALAAKHSCDWFFNGHTFVVDTKMPAKPMLSHTDHLAHSMLTAQGYAHNHHPATAAYDVYARGDELVVIDATGRHDALIVDDKPDELYNWAEVGDCAASMGLVLTERDNGDMRLSYDEVMYEDEALYPINTAEAMDMIVELAAHIPTSVEYYLLREFRRYFADDVIKVTVRPLAHNYEPIIVQVGEYLLYSHLHPKNYLVYRFALDTQSVGGPGIDVITIPKREKGVTKERFDF
jgi:hypothetical protein